MPLPVPSTGDGDDEDRLAPRVAAGPGAWEDEEWLADLRREPLLESLMADGTIAAAAAAGHDHKLDRALNAEVTALTLACGALFPVLGYDSVTADTCCPHCGKRPASANAPAAALETAAAAIPPGRAGRQRTSGRTAAQRRTWTSEPADYTITIVPSNLPKADVNPRS